MGPDRDNLPPMPALLRRVLQHGLGHLDPIGQFDLDPFPSIRKPHDPIAHFPAQQWRCLRILEFHHSPVRVLRVRVERRPGQAVEDSAGCVPPQEPLPGAPGPGVTGGGEVGAGVQGGEGPDHGEDRECPNDQELEHGDLPGPDYGLECPPCLCHLSQEPCTLGLVHQPQCFRLSSCHPGRLVNVSLLLLTLLVLLLLLPVLDRTRFYEFTADLIHAFSNINRSLNFIEHTSQLGWKRSPSFSRLLLSHWRKNHPSFLCFSMRFLL